MDAAAADRAGHFCFAKYAAAIPSSCCVRVFAIHGMTYYIGMYGNDQIDIVGTLPAQIAPPTPLIGFISSKSKNPAAARELLTSLTSPEATAAYKKYLLEPAY